MATSALRASVLVGVAGDARRRPGELAERAEQADDSSALAAVREEQGDVVGVDHAEVAVDGSGGVEDVGAGAGGVERADELLADVGGLADAGDGDAAATVGTADRRPRRTRRRAGRRRLRATRPRPKHVLGRTPSGRMAVCAEAPAWHVPVPKSRRTGMYSPRIYGNAIARL